MTSLIRSSATIKKAIKDRMQELNLSSGQVIRDAGDLNFNIYKGQLSNYLNSSDRYGLTEKQILFICLRYSIPINLHIGTKDKNNNRTLPVHNEAVAIDNVKRVFKIQ